MAAGGAEGETAAEAMGRAAVLEGQLARAAGGDEAGLRRKCADAYLSCGRRMLREAATKEAGGGAGEEAAFECLEKAAKINGLWHASADACGQHARALQKAGEHAGAITSLGRALSLADRARDSETARARKKRQALRDRCVDSWKELVRAPADDMDGPYRTALLADPSRAQTHIDMGYVLAGRGQAGRAAECYEGACEADPGSAEARFRAGTALQEAGEYGRAARRYEEAGRMNAGQARQRAAMGCAQCGRSMAAAGRRAEAAAALGAAARLDPSLALECARAHEECAGAAPRGGGGEAAGAQEEMPPQGAQYASAVKWYQRAGGGGGGEAAAEAARGCARCGRALLERKRPAEAAACLDAAAGLDPAHSLECAAAHEEAAGAALREEGGGGGGAGAEAAAEHYNRAAEMYAGGAGAIGDARGCVRCGEALGRMGRPGEAARWIEAAANLDPAYARECAAAHERAGGAALQAEGGGRGREAAAEHYAGAAAWHGRRRGGGREAAAEAAAGCARCGRLLGEMRRLADAAEALDSAADMDPAHSLECARMHEGCAAEARSRRGGDAEEAVVHYREAARRYGAAGRGGGVEGAAARGCIECGRALGEMGRHVDAAEAFAGAAVLDPSAALECALACAGMAGEARESKGRGKRGDRGEILRLALQCCEAGRAGGAGGAELRIAAADIMLEQGRHAEAAAEYGRACAEDGSLRRRCAEGCVKCGDGLAGGSRAGEALACIRGAQEAGTVESAEAEEACVRWGRTMFDGARYGEAARCFEAGAAAAASAAASAGGGIAAKLGLAASLSMDGRRAEAVRAYREAAGHGGAAALAGSAGGCAARLAIADALLGEGAHGEAEQWYARARAGGTGAEISRAYAGIAGSLHSRSMHAAAHGCIAMAAAAGWPEDRAGTGRLCADIGRGLEEEGRLEQAAYCYAKAAGLDDGLKAECARACMRVGGGMEEAGMRDGAVECYEDAIRMVPGNHEAHFAVADAMVRGGNYNRAAWYYEAAGRHGGDGKRAGFGEAMCRARDLHERARDEVDMQKKRGMYRDAEWAYEAAAKLAPRSHEPRMGAGMACLKQRDDADNYRRAEAHFAEAIARAPPMVEPCMYAAKAVRKHAMGTRDRARYRDALEYYRMAVKRRPRRPIVPRYWMGLCMLCAASGGGEEERAKEFLRGTLDDAEPATSEEMHFCGRMCDILGRHKEAAGHYLGSLKGSTLYSADFYKRIDADLIRTGRIPEGEAPAAAAGDKGGRGGAGRPGSAEPQYVCDTNVVLAYLDHLARKTAFKSPIVPVLEKGMCAVPQVCYNEAHGKTAGSDLSGWLAGTVGRMCTVIKGRGRMDTRMQMAREAFMAGWLYSSEDTIREWCKSADEKAAAKSTRYGGGPPSGRDVLVLATAIDMHVRQRRPSTVRLVTWDRDFGDFADYIRAEAGIEVVRPDDVGG